MKKSYIVTFTLVSLLVFPIMASMINVSAYSFEEEWTGLHKTWGVSKATKVTYTAGYDLDLSLRQAIWDIANEAGAAALAMPPLNSPLNEGEELNVEQIIEKFVDNFMIAQAEFTVTNMSGYETTEIHDGFEESVMDMYSYDWMNVSMKVKRPGDAAFTDNSSNLAISMFDDAGPFITNYLPTNIANNISTAIFNNATMENEFKNSLGSGELPSIPIWWLANWVTNSSDSASIPSWVNDIGIISPNGAGTPLFVPKDWNIGSTWADIKSWLLFPHPELGLDQAIINSSTFPKDLDQLFEQFGTTVEVREKQIQINFDLAGINDSFFMDLSEGLMLDVAEEEGYNLTAQIQMYIDQMESQFNSMIGDYIDEMNSMLGTTADPFELDLDPDSLSAKVALNLKWNTNGILENAHAELDVSIMNGTGASAEKIGFNILADASKGLSNTINRQIEDLEDVPELPGANETDLLTIGSGANQTIASNVGGGISLNVSSRGNVGILLQAWTDNPAADSGGTNTGLQPDKGAIYFSIDVSDESLIDWPIILVVNAPEGVSIENMACVTYNEGSKQWEDTGFEIHANPANSSQAVVIIWHLSVFAVGEGIPDQIPGYTFLPIAIAMLGAGVYLLIKKKPEFH